MCGVVVCLFQIVNMTTYIIILSNEKYPNYSSHYIYIYVQRTYFFIILFSVPEKNIIINHAYIIILSMILLLFI